MKKYTKPTYIMEGVETEDIILASIMIKNAGVDENGNTIGAYETNFSDIFKGVVGNV